MSIREECRDLLRSPAVQCINFICQGVPVTPGLFTSVATALDNTDPSRPIVGVRVDQALPAAIGASYRPSGNVFIFRSEQLSSDYDLVSTVHEAVHCGFDLLRLQRWAWFGQEACGYIAGALFAISAGIPKARIRGFNAEYAYALRIAEEIYSGKRNVTLAAPPPLGAAAGNEPRVTWSQYYPLREGLRTAARTPGTAYTGRTDTFPYNNDGASCASSSVWGGGCTVR